MDFVAELCKESMKPNVYFLLNHLRVARLGVLYSEEYYGAFLFIFLY